MPFKKGESGNPGGRPKAATGLRKELDRRYGDNAKQLLDELDELRKSNNEPRTAFKRRNSAQSVS